MVRSRESRYGKRLSNTRRGEVSEDFVELVVANEVSKVHPPRIVAGNGMIEQANICVPWFLEDGAWRLAPMQLPPR